MQLVTEMLKPEKLSMNNTAYINEILAIGKEYQNTKENSQLINVEIWLNPNYRMSEDDLVIAQELLDEYFAEGTEAEKRFFAESEYDWIEEMANDDWTDEEWHRYQLMCALYTKMDTIRSISAGAVEGVPFCGELFDWSSRMQADIYGYEFEELCSMDNVFANSHTQHPFATLGGNIIGNLLTYNVAAGAARNIPGLSQRISNLSGKLSTYPVLNRIGQDHLTNIIGGTLIETSISTVPGMVKDVWNGESADNVFRNAGLDIGRNLLFNIGGEAVSAAIGKVLTKVPEAVQRIFPKSVEENADDVAEAALKSGSKAGTVWDNITSTADNMPATEIPATFKIDLDGNINYVNPETGTNTLWTNSNATKHMGEYVSRFGEESWSIGTRSQAMLESYSASLNKAMETIGTETPGRYFGTYGNWELGINTETGVVYHARMIN